LAIFASWRESFRLRYRNQSGHSQLRLPDP
jgi:hypothetical protein